MITGQENNEEKIESNVVWCVHVSNIIIKNEENV